jgi:glycosyltransferase involved in cell wall biosynthesis
VLDHLAGLSCGPTAVEVVVADGGSTDGTAARARAHGRADVVLELPAGSGRAAQLNAAARAARGDVLVFLHADSRLPARAGAALRAAAGDPGLAGGNFALRFGDRGMFGAVLTAVYAFQRRLGFYYGDSTVWLARATFRIAASA